MKITRFVKGMKLICRRRKALLESEDLHAPDFKLFMVAMFLLHSTIAFYLIVFTPASVLNFLMHPYTVSSYFSLPTSTITIHLSIEAMYALIVIWAILLIYLLSISKTSWQTLYHYCLDRIKSDEAQDADHGNTIAEVLRGLRDEPIEYLAVFNANGVKIAETTLYDTTQVRSHDAVFQAMYRQGNCIKIHNHPSTHSGFSENDVVAAIQYRASKTIVVAQDLIYTLELTPAAWKLDTDAVAKQYAAAYAYHKALGATPVPDKEHMAFILALNAMLAEQYGMKLTVEKFNESQYFQAQPAAEVKCDPAPVPVCNSQPTQPSTSWSAAVIAWLKTLVDAQD